jgi:F-box-like
MSRLQELPTELLLSVFQSLGDVDDALHLARSCSYLYRTFNDPRNRHSILKSIIVRCRTHVTLKDALLEC